MLVGLGDPLLVDPTCDGGVLAVLPALGVGVSLLLGGLGGGHDILGV